MSTLTITAAIFLLMMACSASAFAREPAAEPAPDAQKSRLGNVPLLRASTARAHTPDYLPSDPDVRRLHHRLRDLFHGPARVSLIPGGAKVAYRWTLP